MTHGAYLHTEDVEIDDYTPVDGIPGAWAWLDGAGPFWCPLANLAVVDGEIFYFWNAETNE